VCVCLCVCVSEREKGRHGDTENAETQRTQRYRDSEFSSRSCIKIYESIVSLLNGSCHIYKRRKRRHIQRKKQAALHMSHVTTSMKEGHI